MPSHPARVSCCLQVLKWAATRGFRTRGTLGFDRLVRGTRTSKDSREKLSPQITAPTIQSSNAVVSATLIDIQYRSNNSPRQILPSPRICLECAKPLPGHD